MMMGVVIGKEEKTPALAYSHGKPQKEVAKVKTHLEGAVKIPGFRKEASVKFTPEVEGRNDEACSSISRSVEKPKKKNRKARR